MSEASYSGTQTFTNLGSPTGRISFGNDIQSDNYVTLQDGWNIGRDTGDAEFNNVLVRGNSTVTSSTIGGDAAVGWSFISSDPMLGDTLPDSGTITGSGVTELTTPTEWIAASVADIAGFTASGQQGNFFLSGRLTSGASADSINDFTDSSFDLTLTFQYNDVNGDLISSEAQTYTYTRDDFSFFSFAGTLLNSVDFSELNRITIPNNTETVSILANFSFSAGSNWGLLELDVTNPRYASLVPKPTTSAAYISSPDLNQFALDVRGGRGARVNSIELFRGSAQDVTSFGAEGGEEEMLYVQVSWLDTNDDGSGGLSNLQATVPFVKSNSDAAQAIHSEEPDTFTPIVTSTPIYNRSGDYVGVLSATSFFTSLTIHPTGAASNISEQRIRRIWSKLK